VPATITLYNDIQERIGTERETKVNIKTEKRRSRSLGVSKKEKGNVENRRADDREQGG